MKTHGSTRQTAGLGAKEGTGIAQLANQLRSGAFSCDTKFFFQIEYKGEARADDAGNLREQIKRRLSRVTESFDPYACSGRVHHEFSIRGKDVPKAAKVFDTFSQWWKQVVNFKSEGVSSSGPGNCHTRSSGGSGPSGGGPADGGSDDDSSQPPSPTQPEVQAAGFGGEGATTLLLGLGLLGAGGDIFMQQRQS